MKIQNSKTHKKIKLKFVRSIFLILSFFIHSQASGQTTKIDSLYRALKTSREDTSKVKLLNDLGFEINFEGEYGKADSFAKIALRLGQKLIYKKGMAQSFSLLAVVMKNQGENKQALDYYLEALKLYEDVKDIAGIAGTRGNIGVIYYLQSDHKSSLENYTIALNLYEQLQDKTAIARYLGNIGMVYDDQGEYPKALEYYFKALKLKEQEKDKSGIAKYSGTIGNIFYYQSDYTKALEYYDKALKIKEQTYKETGKKKDRADICLHLGNKGNVYYSKKNFVQAIDFYSKALKIAEELENKQLMANNMGNLGNVYLAQENFSMALEFYLKTLSIAEVLENKPLITNNLSNIGSLYIKQNNFDKAEQFLQKALKIAIEIGYYDAEKEIHQSLSDLYRRQKRWEPALQHYQLYITAKDSIFNEENTRKTVRSELNFEFEKKQAIEKAEQEKKNAIEAKEKQKQKIITYSISSILFLVALFSLFIFRSYRQKQKDNIVITLQKDEVEKSKKIIEHQKEIVEEKQKDILDSITYAKRIQYTLLAHEEFLKQNLPEHFVFFQPKDIVSGDFYWATKIITKAETERFYLAVCDSTGHGVPGAFMSLLNISFLNEAINEKNIEVPNEILNYVRERLIRSVSKEGAQDGMDGILICFERSGSGHLLKITYSAAHNVPLWVSNGTIIDLKTDKMPIGKGEKSSEFTLHEINAVAGDTLFLYTDGFADQFGGPKGKKFKYKQLNELLVEISGKTMPEQKDKLANTLLNWKGDLEQVDDILIMGIAL